ncbi:MAG TPA: ABC transporter transmembrane domain-containing protein, partial [Rhabdochlamydiaceae bacterium]
MNLLLKAALRNRRHFTLLIMTFTTLFVLTIANQLEMFSLGILANTGSDFFTLFSPEKNAVEAVSLTDVQARWAEIDTTGTGVITKHDASAYIAQQKAVNPINMAFHYVKENFQLANNVTALVFILVAVAIFKAIWLFASRYTTQLLAIRVSRDLRQQYFEHIQQLPMSFYQQHNIGSLSSRVVGDAGQIASSINSGITNYLQTPFTVITSLVMCFCLSWKLSMVIFFGMPLIVIP